jgi:hypothetical protein
MAVHPAEYVSIAYFESACTTSSRTSAWSSIARRSPSSSPMLFVPTGSAPAAHSPSSPTHAHPVGPGFPLHAPSVATT